MLFSLIPVGFATNSMGGAGGPLAVLFVTILAAELGKAVSKETKIDILVTPIVTVLAGIGFAALIAAPVGPPPPWDRPSCGPRSSSPSSWASSSPWSSAWP